MKRSSIRRAVIVAVAAAGLSMSATVSAYEYAEREGPSAAAMAVDVIVLRPAGLITTALGVGLYTVSLPFALIGDNSRVAGHRLVAEPFRYTFMRPLGDFESELPDE